MPIDVQRAQPRVQRFRRKLVRLPVRISSIDPEVDPETGKPYFVTAEELCGDLSRGGAFVMTPEPPRPGSRLLVELALPDGEAVQAVARVAWTRVRLPSEGPDVHSGFGVEFLGGARRHLVAIEEFVAASASRKRRGDREAPAPGVGPPA
jgi:Tfp pilus assembly protein PilZ